MNYNPQNTYNQYKLRIATYNTNGPKYCVTIPREIAEQFKQTKFTITFFNNQIVLTSGQDISQLKKEIKNYEGDIWKEVLQ